MYPESSKRRMPKIYPLILAVCFLKFSDGYEVGCTVSGDARGLLYTVPQFKAEECWYSWADENNIVLADYLGHNEELVVMQTNHTLLLKKCKLLIYYRRNCHSEKGLVRYTCKAGCVASAELDPLNPLNPLNPKASVQTSWGLFAVVFSIILVLLVGVVLCFVFRARICRGSCFYSAVKRQDIENRRQSMEEGIPF